MPLTTDLPLRFYDNCQKYPEFVATGNEKWRLAKRATLELKHLRQSAGTESFRYRYGRGGCSQS
jgi:hypothetical protein